MKAIDIGPHPESPDLYFSFGKPPSWQDDDCGTLTVRRVATTGDILAEPATRIVNALLPSGETYYPAYMSEWEPTPEELERLNAGLPIRMLVSGNALPPVALWVRGEDEI